MRLPHLKTGDIVDVVAPASACSKSELKKGLAAIRALGIRSMLVTPIREENRVVGVLAAFAPTPHAFTITHVAVLKTMADQIAVLLQKERRMRDENPQAEAPRPAAPAVVAKPVSAPTPIVQPVVIKSATSQAAAPAPAHQDRRPRVGRREPPRRDGEEPRRSARRRHEGDRHPAVAIPDRHAQRIGQGV